MINLSKVDFNYSEYIKIMNKNHFSGWLIILVFIVTLVPIKVIADEYERATGFIIQRNFSAAIKELEPLAKQGNEKAQIRLAIYYTKREIYDSALAKYWITQAANRDNADAQEMLGTFFDVHLFCMA